MCSVYCRCIATILRKVERDGGSKYLEELNALWHLEKSSSALPYLLITACALSSISGHFSTASCGIAAHKASTLTAWIQRPETCT